MLNTWLVCHDGNPRDDNEELKSKPGLNLSTLSPNNLILQMCINACLMCIASNIRHCASNKIPAQQKTHKTPSKTKLKRLPVVTGVQSINCHIRLIESAKSGLEKRELSLPDFFLLTPHLPHLLPHLLLCPPHKLKPMIFCHSCTLGNPMWTFWHLEFVWNFVLRKSIRN